MLYAFMGFSPNALKIGIRGVQCMKQNIYQVHQLFFGKISPELVKMTSRCHKNMLFQVGYLMLRLSNAKHPCMHVGVLNKLICIQEHHISP